MFSERELFLGQTCLTLHASTYSPQEKLFLKTNGYSHIWQSSKLFPLGTSYAIANVWPSTMSQRETRNQSKLTYTRISD